MKNIVERLSMLQGMRDEMVESLGSIVDCATPSFQELDAAIRCLDDHHIHRLRISLDLGEEIPLAQWLSRRREGLPILSDAQRDRLLHNAMIRAKELAKEARGYVLDPGGTCLCRQCGLSVSALEDACDKCNNRLDWNA